MFGRIWPYTVRLTNNHTPIEIIFCRIFYVVDMFKKKVDEEKVEQLLSKHVYRYLYYMKDNVVKYLNSFPSNMTLIDLAFIILRIDQGYILPVFHKEAYQQKRR